MREVAKLFINCLRYIFAQEMKFVWKVLLGLLLLLLFYYSRLSLDVSVKDFVDTYNQYYSCTEFVEVCLL
jgi:hypothetical protein